MSYNDLSYFSNISLELVEFVCEVAGVHTRSFDTRPQCVLALTFPISILTCYSLVSYTRKLVTGADSPVLFRSEMFPTMYVGRRL
jgi:hypothetical protein